MKSKLSGVTTALVTPFKDGQLDLASLRRLLRVQIKQGVRGFVINGTTGESPTLTLPEVERLFTTAREETNGQATLILGTGSNSTDKSIEFTLKTADWKPDAVLVVVPYYNRPPARGLKKHFEAIAQAASAPVILYNVPSRTVASLDVATVVDLSHQHTNIAGIKEASGDLGVALRLRAECRADFVLLSGDDGSCVDFAARGGDGVIAVASHLIGAEMADAIRLAQAGDKQISDTYKQKYASLLRWLYIEANPIPVKMALKMCGLIDSAEMRLPLVELDIPYQKELRACLSELGKI